MQKALISSIRSTHVVHALSEEHAVDLAAEEATRGMGYRANVKQCNVRYVARDVWTATVKVEVR